MKPTYVIGDREKNEWLAQFNQSEKKMSFCSILDKAMLFDSPQNAGDTLQEMQLTGYFTDLGVYILQDGKAYIAGERDNYHPTN